VDVERVNDTIVLREDWGDYCSQHSAVVSIYGRLKDKSRFVVNIIIYVNSYYARRSR